MQQLLAMLPDSLRRLSRAQLFAVVAALYFALRRLGSWGETRARRKFLQQRADAKRARRDAKRQEVVARLKLEFTQTRDGAAIIGMTATELLDAMAAGRYTSEEITTAFCARSVQAAGELNPTTEELFEEAIAEARRCDTERRAGKLRGPLHGLPISVKDQIHQKGTDATCGLADRVDRPSAYTAVLIEILEDAGAIPFVRTNVPQCLMLPESMNHIWGTSCNPYDVARTTGGSSGGEGALVACGGSPLGIGTDIGGSVRIPAAYCGVVGFKPTPQRMSAHGMGVPRPGDSSGQNAVSSVAGPLARCVDDADLVMRLWCGDRVPSKMHAVDPRVPPLPWNTAVATSTRKLKFAIWRADKFFPPSLPVARAVGETAEALKAAGHEVVEMTFDLSRATTLYVGLMAAEGNFRGFVEGLQGEKLHPYYNYLYTIANVPNSVRTVVGGLKRLTGAKREEELLEAGKMSTVYTFWEKIKARERVKVEYIQYLTQNGIDAVICPQPALPALRHGGSEYLALGCSYTFMWNNLHFPAGHVPTTYVRPDEQTYAPVYSDKIDGKAAENMKGTAGLPVGVQVVTMPWQDELCVKAMRDVEAAVAGSFKQPKLETGTTLLRAQ